MKKNSINDASRAVVILLASGACVPVWATGSGYTYTCVDPMATNYAKAALPDGSSSYQTVEGVLGSCPSGQTGCLIDFTKHQSSCTYHSTDLAGAPVTVTIDSSRDGTADWSAQCSGVGGSDCKGVALVDSVTTSDTNKFFRKSCLYNFGIDAASGMAGFGGRTVGTLRLCSDGVYERIPEPLPEPAAVSGCFIASGQSKVIDGVDVQCPEVPEGEQRTIVVVSDTVTNGEGMLVAPEGFGFSNARGDIDFGNICVCIGGTGEPPVELECAPTTAYQERFPELNLPLCSVGEGAQPITELQIQNPRCVVVGGSRRCY